MRPEDALVERRSFRVDGGRWVVEERWNLDHPSCPFVVQYLSPLQDSKNYIVQHTMTEQQYQRFFGAFN